MTTYTNLTIAPKYSDEDESFIATGTTQGDKDLYRALIASVVDTNGKSADIVPGIGKQYIAHENYFQIYCPRATNDFFNGNDSYGVMSPRFNAKLMNPISLINLADEKLPNAYGSYKLTNYEQSITNYLNWVALGSSRGALAGAAIRAAIIQEIDIKRECNIVTRLTAEQTKGLKDYLTFLDANLELFAFWKSNVNNVLAIAAAVFLKEGHHFDSRNNRPQKAMLAALDHKDVFSDDDIRRIFYLAVHPYPMIKLMHYVKYADGFIGINEAGKCRLRGAPAGTAQYIVTASAINNVKGETFMAHASDTFLTTLDHLTKVKENVIANPLPYHTMCGLITTEPKKEIVYNDSTTLAFLCAYIQVCVKGSLANAASLRKIEDANSRLVQKYKTALSEWIEKKGDDLIMMISGDTKSLKKILRDEEIENKVAVAVGEAKIKRSIAQEDTQEADS